MAVGGLSLAVWFWSIRKLDTADDGPSRSLLRASGAPRSGMFNGSSLHWGVHRRAVEVSRGLGIGPNSLGGCSASPTMLRSTPDVQGRPDGRARGARSWWNLGDREGASISHTGHSIGISRVTYGR